MEERTCYVCGETKPLISKYWKKTKNGYTQQCKTCVSKRARALKEKQLMEADRQCPSCKEIRKGKDFPKGSGNRVCFVCEPNGKDSKSPKRHKKEGGELTDEELEKRYQKMMKDMSFITQIKRPDIKIGDKLKITRNDPEQKFGLHKDVKGVVIAKTNEFIVVEKPSKTRECFRFIDIAIGDYEVKGV